MQAKSASYDWLFLDPSRLSEKHPRLETGPKIEPKKRQPRPQGDSFNTKNFFSEGQKNLVNSENKENLSNYRLLKRKPSVCSTSLHFSKLITVMIQFFFA